MVLHNQHAVCAFDRLAENLPTRVLVLDRKMEIDDAFLDMNDKKTSSQR